MASDAGIRLDYSIESIEVVEQQLASLHNSMPSRWVDRPSDKEIRRVSYAFGAYIAEVLKRKFGGHWSKESTLLPGQPTFHVGGLEMWPQQKVEKRLRNGPEDNVWHYFKSGIARFQPQQ